MSSAGGGWRSQRQQQAQWQRPAGTAVASWSVVTRMTTVTGRLEQCVDGLQPGRLAGGPQRSDKMPSVHSVFGCDGEPRGWRNLPVYARQEDWLDVVTILLSTKEQRTSEWDFSRESSAVLTVHLKNVLHSAATRRRMFDWRALSHRWENVTSLTPGYSRLAAQAAAWNTTRQRGRPK